MSKSIEFTYEGKDIKLEYTKRTVKQMEERGFSISDINDKPMSMVLDLFAGAFLANHRNYKREKVEEIYAHMPNKEKLIEKLAEMYNEPLEGLMDEPDEDDGKKVNWMTSW